MLFLTYLSIFFFFCYNVFQFIGFILILAYKFFLSTCFFSNLTCQFDIIAVFCRLCKNCLRRFYCQYGHALVDFLSNSANLSLQVANFLIKNFEFHLKIFIIQVSDWSGGGETTTACWIKDILVYLPKIDMKSNDNFTTINRFPCQFFTSF